MGGGDAVPRFFIEPREAETGDTLVLAGEDARHISFSLRARVGEEYTLCDTCNYEYRCVIRAIDSESVTFEVLEKRPGETEPDVQVTLYQALVKGDKFDTVVQKAVELGVARIVPVLSERCVSRPDEKSLNKKRGGVSNFAVPSFVMEEEHAMQCARASVPEIGELLSFGEMTEELQEADCGFICYEAEPHIPMKTLFSEKSKEKKAIDYRFFIGPEGGISAAEAQKAQDAGISLISLGKRILRTETAPLCVISSIMFFSDNLN